MSNLLDTTFLWKEHAMHSGCRFNAAKKAVDALIFTQAEGGTTFAIPSKLEGTSRAQDTLTKLAERPRFEPLQLEHDAECGQVNASWFGTWMRRSSISS